MIVRQTALKLITNPALNGYGNSLRGSIAAQFPENELVHNHTAEGRFLYIYPRILYRVDRGDGYMTGIDEGSDLLKDIEPAIQSVEMKGNYCKVVEKQLTIKEVAFSSSKDFYPYTFRSPWLALNEENYSAYGGLKTEESKRSFLAKILTGNLLSIAKSFGYDVEEAIRVGSLKLREQKTFLKGTPMLGFLGVFSVNFEIPDFWGLGKSVSRGFGCVKRM